MAFNKQKVINGARKAAEKGQYDKAIREYTRVVQEDPKDVRIWLKIGDLHVKQGTKQDAIQTYEKVALFYSEQGFFLKAVAVYKQILKLDASLIEINVKLAELYRQLGLLSDAASHFEVVAAHFQREGKTTEALATLRQLVDLDEGNVATRIKLAEMYSQENQKKEAIEHFTYVCNELRKQGRNQDLLKVGERLLWHDEGNIELSCELAELYLKTKEPRKALQKLQSAFQKDRKNRVTLALLAKSFGMLGETQKAVSVLHELAKLFERDRDKNGAREVYRSILEMAPDDAEANAYLGRKVESAPASMPEPESPPPAAPQSSPSEETREIEEEILEQHDELSHSSMQGELHAEEIEKVLTETEVYLKYQLHDKALEHLQRVFDLDPRNREAHEKMKEVFLLQGREGDAVAKLVELVGMVKGYDRAAAEEYVREGLQLDPEHRQIKELAEQLDVQGMTVVPVEEEPREAVRSEWEQNVTAAGKNNPMLDEVTDVTKDVTPSEILSGVEEIFQDYDAIEELPPPPAFDAEAAKEFERDVASVREQGGQNASLDGTSSERWDIFVLVEPDDLPPIPEFDADAAALFDREIGFREAVGQAGDVIEVSSEVIETSDILEDIEAIDEELLEEVIEEEPDEISDELADELDEADFYLAQGMVEEAQESLTALLAQFGRHPEIEKRILQIETGQLMGEEGTDVSEVSDDESLVPDGVTAAEAESHYEMGMAYLDMGLFNEAESEYRAASQNDALFAQCQVMIGVCQRENKNIEAAIQTISEVLDGDVAEGVRLQALYELSTALEAGDQKQEALRRLEELVAIDSDYLDAAGRAATLRGEL